MSRPGRRKTPRSGRDVPASQNDRFSPAPVTGVWLRTEPGGLAVLIEVAGVWCKVISAPLDMGGAVLSHIAETSFKPGPVPS